MVGGGNPAMWCLEVSARGVSLRAVAAAAAAALPRLVRMLCLPPASPFVSWLFFCWSMLIDEFCTGGPGVPNEVPLLRLVRGLIVVRSFARRK